MREDSATWTRTDESKWNISMRGGAMTSVGERSLGALCRLEPGWRVFRNRRVAAGGEQYAIHFIILHRDYGLGLIVLAPQEHAAPDTAVRLMRTMLGQCGFERRFSGFLPIVFVALNPEDSQVGPERIAKAFAATPRIAIKDASWVDWTSKALDALEEARAEPEDPSNVIDVEVAATRRRPRRLRRLLVGAITTLTISVAVVGTLVNMRVINVGAKPLGTDHGPATSVGTANPVAARPALEAKNQTGRLMSEEHTARYLSLELATFREKYAALRASGFPAPEAITGNYDQAAIDRWLDAQSRQE